MMGTTAIMTVPAVATWPVTAESIQRYRPKTTPKRKRNAPVNESMAMSPKSLTTWRLTNRHAKPRTRRSGKLQATRPILSVDDSSP